METATLRVPKPLYEAIRGKAEADRRSINSMAVLLLEGAIADEPWVKPVPVAEVSQEEREWATGDPLESEPEPPFVPVAKAAVAAALRDDPGLHFKPDFGSKLGKKR